MIDERRSDEELKERGFEAHFIEKVRQLVQTKSVQTPAAADCKNFAPHG